METTENSTSGEPLLDLNTLVVRPVIAIDGKRYEILSASELSVLDSHRFGVWGRRIQALSDDDSEDGRNELRALVDMVARKVAVGVPDDVFNNQSGSNKLAIVDVFTGLLLRDRLGVAGAIAKAAGMGASLPTGEKSFPSSSAITGGTRNGGWKKRLLRIFGLS